MDRLPCTQRTFPLQLAPAYVAHYALSLHFLKMMLERLGEPAALDTWRQAFEGADDELFYRTLEQGWQVEPGSMAGEVEASLAGLLVHLFRQPVQGVSAEQAGELVDKAPPFAQLTERFPMLNAQRTSTTYDALHLFRHGLARLAETLIERYGKAGEYLVLETMLREIASRPVQETSPEEFFDLCSSWYNPEAETPTISSAGQELELKRTGENELTMRVTACEWARYYRERHPRVGYLMACSTDAAYFQSYHPDIRLQRTTTLMEGEDHCDFRIYTSGSAQE